ncbi:MAG: non-ribosomal peptide synthetase, partial [Acidobacteriota bacterium]
AVRCGDASLTYGELAARAGRLGRHLRDLGVVPETAVALAVGRGVGLPVSQLAVLEAGGYFVPLEPAYPQERLAVMLEDSGAGIILRHGDSGADLPEALLEGLQVVDLDGFDWNAGDGSPLAEGPAADNLAYVMFTSGSTGRPKGVAVSHRNIVRLVRGNDFASMGNDEVWLGFAPAAFDASTLEIWAPMLNGGELDLLPGADLALEDLADHLRSRGVTSLWLTAGLFHQMAEGGHLSDLPSVRQLLAGGDALSAERVREALDQLPEGARVINGYGPTENTTFTTCHPMTRGDGIPARVPIGRPIRGGRVLVVDPGLRTVPRGVHGELLAGGDGLARGYIGRPALTAERFVPDPSAPEPGARAYRTGDRVRWRHDGALEFLGRSDFQVKIRGFRIEPAEVQVQLERHPGLAAAAVVAQREASGETSGEARLVAYVVQSEDGGKPADPAAELRTFLGQRLPEYMVPSAFVPLDALPLTANGKLDRAALPAPDWSAAATVEYVAPRTDLESRLAEIWTEVLPVDRVGIHDDFFELGGHSLLATQVVSRLRKTFGTRIPLGQLFTTPTLSQLAELLEAEAAEGNGGDGATAEIRRSEETSAEKLLAEAGDMADEDLDALLGSMMTDAE